MNTGADQDDGGYKLHRTVVLVGMMGSGKTAIGRALSSQLGVPFRDSDEEIVAASQQTIAEIFKRDGEPFFRTRETEVIKRLLTDTPGVLSTGGGAFLQKGNRELIAEVGVAVWLDAPLPLLWDRVKGKDTRPLLMTDDPLATLTKLYNERAPFYAEAGLRLPIKKHSSIEETTGSLIELLTKHEDILERK